MITCLELTYHRQDRRLLWSWMSASIWDMRRSRRSTSTILLAGTIRPSTTFYSAFNFYGALNIYTILNSTLDPCHSTFLRRRLSTALPSWLCLDSRWRRKFHSSTDFRLFSADELSKRADHQHRHYSCWPCSFLATLSGKQCSRERWNSAAQGTRRPNRFSHPRSRDRYYGQGHLVRQRAYHDANQQRSWDRSQPILLQKRRPRNRYRDPNSHSRPRCALHQSKARPWWPVHHRH